VLLGEITCPSGELVLMDGGYLGLWSEPHAPGVDFEIVGPDAAVAARSFDRQSGRTLYDIPEHATGEFTELFAAHCREHALTAELRPFDQRVPCRERVRRAIAAGEPDFLITGVPVVPVGGLPTDRPLPVVATPAADGAWAHLRIQVGDATAPVAKTEPMGSIGVDWARFAFADADAVAAWVHEEPVDGMADVVFWGLHEAEVAAEFDAPRTGTPGDDHYGWLDLPIADAYAKAVALEERRGAEPERRFAFDFRPHSHHWAVMAGVRASEHEAATIEVGGAHIMFAMTSVGDGFFPVHVDRAPDGTVAAIQVTIQDS
jgi:hypothetical protein